jgi:hypothetical protein
MFFLGVSIFGEDQKMNFLWVENFPLFLPKEDGSNGDYDFQFLIGVKRVTMMLNYSVM